MLLRLCCPGHSIHGERNTPKTQTKNQECGSSTEDMHGNWGSEVGSCLFSRTVGEKVAFKCVWTGQALDCAHTVTWVRHTACGVKELPLGSLEKVIVLPVCSRCIQALPPCDKWTSWTPVLWCESPHLRPWHTAVQPRNWEGSGFPEESLHSQSLTFFVFLRLKRTPIWLRSEKHVLNTFRR